MPHAESTTETMVNGDRLHSQFLSHLGSYPVVSDTIAAYKSNPYGAKSLNLAAHAQTAYIDPVLSSKQAQQASSYITPLAAKADAYGESGLQKVDAHFPLIKEDTATVKDTVLTFILTPVTLPLAYARWGYDWTLDTYAKELKAHGSSEGKEPGFEGLIVQGKAVLTTGLVAVGESAAWVREMLKKADQEAGAKVTEIKDLLVKKGQETKKEADKQAKEVKKDVNGTN